MPLTDFFSTPEATIDGYKARFSSVEVSREGFIESLTMEVPS
jgi:hypothetical protein